jgi:hypothetical protein
MDHPLLEHAQFHAIVKNLRKGLLEHLQPLLLLLCNADLRFGRTFCGRGILPDYDESSVVVLSEYDDAFLWQ